LGAEYVDNPAVAGNALVYSPLMTIKIVDCITAALSPAKSVVKLSQSFSEGSGSHQVKITNLMTNSGSASCWGTCLLKEQ
jgi:hypothetical protein